jgi:hypothetical protein
MASPTTIFQAFKPLPRDTRTDLVNYNLRNSVDEMAGDLAGKPDIRRLLPATELAKLKDKPAILAWLESLIPADKRKPNDDWKAVFVRNFTGKWVTNKYPTATELATEMGKTCVSNRGAANSYYDQTLLMDVDAASPFRSEYTTNVKRAWTGVDRVGWRGDDRKPETIVGSNCDGTGFAPRKRSEAPIWRTDESKLDVDTDTTVCVAVDIRGCAFFPLSKPVKNTWVYCILLGEGWNTYYLQTKIAADKKLTAGSKEFNNKVWLFNERCVSSAKPSEIACAIQLEREIRDGKDPLTGVRFRLGEVRRYDAFRSLNASLLIKIQNSIAKYANWYPAAPKWLTYQGEVD